MNVIELLEATKVEVDNRWARGCMMYDGGSCILGCLGFAAFGGNFAEGLEETAYTRLREDPLAVQAIDVLGEHSTWPVSDPLERVWRHNDTRFTTKQDVKDYIDLALADLRE